MEKIVELIKLKGYKIIKVNVKMNMIIVNSKDLDKITKLVNGKITVCSQM